MSTSTQTSTPTIQVPYRLDFAPGGGFVPGRGAAGYTVATVPLATVGAFLAALPREAWMPGTYRCHACYEGTLSLEGGGAAPMFYGCNRCEYCAEI